MGMFLLLFWGLVAGDRLEFLFGQLDGDIEMFFLSGIAMVTASTFVLIYNADIFLAALRAGRRPVRPHPAGAADRGRLSDGQPSSAPA